MALPHLVTQPAAPFRFLVVDDNDEHRFLLVKTLLRKFPSAVIHETSEGSRALALAETDTHAGIVVHRTADMTGAELVQALRALKPEAIVVMVSGFDRSREAQTAGATGFLLYDEWLRVGVLMASLIQRETGRGSGGL